MKKEEKDARLLDRCGAKRTEWAKHWQCDGSIQNLEGNPWKNEELSVGTEQDLERLRWVSPQEVEKD